MTNKTQQMIQDGLWRDIAEAPKDGTILIVRYPPTLRTDVEYIERISWFDGGVMARSQGLILNTHPLPPPTRRPPSQRNEGGC